MKKYLTLKNSQLFFLAYDVLIIVLWYSLASRSLVSFFVALNGILGVQLSVFKSDLIDLSLDVKIFRNLIGLITACSLIFYFIGSEYLVFEIILYGFFAGLFRLMCMRAAYWAKKNPF
jgi:hypothetical protein